MKNSEKISIKNTLLQIDITKVGAELCSIKNNDNQEYIWQADPKIWGSHAPVLFPIIGGLKNNLFYYQGEEYTVPKHGFIRHNEALKITNHQEHSITFQYKYDSETLKTYPFKFEFNITFSLNDKVLTVSHEVINHDSEKMLFSLGGHPAFKCPLKDNQNYDDYSLVFEEKETSNRHLINDKGLQNGRTLPFLENTDTLQLKHELFNEDALIFKDLKSKRISLTHKTNGKVVTVSYPDFDYVGIWAKPDGDFVCIEPWLGITDHEDTNGDFDKKEGIISLAGKNTFKAEYTIEIHS
ncbi:aldose 1-epimerase family protein [Joostella atrarenae]|uniref:Aldose 1-epimerase family protein n=1 Tax=Joostella atrarenae TaxID=679257 RepID=A0ABS9J788_9FLAO|nr:aldose 1-epimerase family protein [Joostella atrarenae]MCF8716298.1 aldose 1-epimerase family protein [Joostella atrarenae]